MKCPYCDKEMELGVISSPQELSWIKGEKKPFFAKAEFHDGAVVLSEVSFTKGSAVTAYFVGIAKKLLLTIPRNRQTYKF